MVPRILFLGQVAYADSLARMRAFNVTRNPDTRDEFWVLEHPPVYTQGTSCEMQPLGAPDIPVVKSDRGGQITYHGPGQLIIYLMLDLKRLNMGPKRLVACIESALIETLARFGIAADRRPGAPGVYTADEKIAALGLRIRNGACYHGLSLNIDMDLSPFECIDPCGYSGLKVTKMASLGVTASASEITDQLIDCLIEAIYSPIETAARA